MNNASEKKQAIVSQYRQLVDDLNAEMIRLRRKNRFFVASELLTFAFIISCLVCYTVFTANGLWFLAAGAFLVLYILIRREDGKNAQLISHKEDLLSVYEKELSFHRGDVSCFDDGQRYVDANHPFTFDLDIFGSDSLYQRINRTVTTGGSDYLAHCLQHLPTNTGSSMVEQIRRRSQAVIQLAPMLPLRAEFMSHGQRGQVDTQRVRNAIKQTSSAQVPSYPSSTLALVVAFLVLFAFWTMVVLSIIGLVPAGVVLTWGFLQMMLLLMLCSRPIRMIHQSFNTLSKTTESYVQLLKLMAATDLSKVDDPELKLMVADSALQPFEELKHILDSLDRRGNLLGLVLFDTFFLSDFFLIRRFLRWRKHDLTAIDEWIGQVSVMDALVSMATFRYNEPAAAQAELVDSKELVYDASQIWHPFLGDKAVCNDFSIKHLHYYIVTGANMAGKSTFLRALGVNYVLALNGMPVFARGLRVSLYSLFTSMRTTDNLSRGISYFNAELLRLRQLIEECRRQGNTLIILDEILKGTNSLDKLNGSRLFLEEISKMAVTGVVATHDLGLSTLEDEHPDRFHNYCFEISLSDKITYTYKITAGVARNQNATYLLKGILKE